LSEGRSRRPRLSLALKLGRLAEDLTQKEVEEKSGVPDLSALETNREPERRKVEELFAAMGRSLPEEVDIALFCADLLRRPETPIGSPVEPTLEEARALTAAAALEAGAVFQVTLEQLTQLLRETKAKTHRQEAEPLLQDLLRRPAAERRRMVEEYEAYRTWALAERTAFASVKLAAHDADAALDLARLAVRMAELTPGSEEWRSRLGGLCWGLLANATRVKGDFPAAEAAFLRSNRLWLAGAAADPGQLLDGTRLLDLKASLRRYQGRFEEAVDLLAQALALSRSEERTARLLLKKSATSEQMGDWQGAIEALEEARPLVERQGDLRNRWVLEFNLCTCLCDSGRYTEGEALLPRVTGLAVELRNGLDLLRCRWLRGRLAAGQGRLKDAVTELEWVAGELVASAIAFDAGRACLDLAELYLRQRRAAEVKRLSGQIVAVFRAQRVHLEALAAVILFHEAAEQERATVELARKLAAYLRKAQHDPDLHFEP
jgi:tetratricopeptide (TPR) repeat protein